MERPDACNSGDTVIWKEKHSNHWGSFDDTIFVTATGGIGMNVAGSVYVLPLKAWHRLAGILFKEKP